MVQQRDCDRWLIDFNNVRPHEALGGKTPAEVYRPCVTVLRSCVRSTAVACILLTIPRASA